MLDTMIANMLGIKPEEMQEMLGGMQTLLKSGVAKLDEIHAQNKRILELLEGKANGPE